MIRRIARPLVTAVLATGLAMVAAVPASAAATSPALPTTSCSGTIHTSVSTTDASVTGSATCTGLATLSLTTTVHTAGAVSSVTNLLPALPAVPLPISTAIPAVGVTSACATLVDTGSGATISASCSAG
jgi:hypothetical protein